MTDAINLLPSNQTAYERSHEDVDAGRNLDPDRIRRVKDALLCDERFLPVLAWERGVDLWYDDWSIEKKRYVTDQWFFFERLKGTPEGFRRFYNLVGAKVLKIFSPPQESFSRAAWTDEERARWLSQFQQIRIYPYVPVTEFAKGFFASSMQRSKAFVGHVWPTAYRVTIDTVWRQARLYEPRTGEETQLTRREIVRSVVHVGQVYEFEDIVLPAKKFGLYVGDHIRNKYIGADNAPERVIRTEIVRPYNVAVSRPQWTSYAPDARKLVSIKPELVRNRFHDDGPFLGHTSTGLHSAIYPRREKAWQHVYERFYLFDYERDSAVVAGQPGSYLGHARLSMKAFSAEIKLEIRGKRRRFEFTDVVGKYLTPENREPLNRALAATRACKDARSTIYLDTRTRRPREFGDRMLFGDEIPFASTVET
jgi:phage tail P2-like protein